MGKPTLSPEDQKTFDNCIKGGLSLQLVNGGQELRDALASHYDLNKDEDPTCGGDFILAVNGERSVRDQLTGYITKD